MEPNASEIRDPGLADAGQRRIDWAARQMPVLAAVGTRLARERPLEGIRISACLHLTAETATLARVLQDAGARLVLCASNPLSTQDDVAAALSERAEIPVHGIRGETLDDYGRHLEACIAHQPNVVMDDGGDLTATLHARHAERLGDLLGGTEETTTGVMRLMAMAHDGALRYPVIAVNDAKTKHLFDNRYGTGQSTVDGLLRATNVLLAGKVFVVAGYGWCGRGIAMRARGMGAQVVVTEVAPVPALEAAMEGLRVMPMAEAAPIADIVVTATGNAGVVDDRILDRLKDGCILANSGHFDVEIDVAALRARARSAEGPRPNLKTFLLDDGRRLHLVAEGRLANLGAAEGHPSSVMDMSFAGQALAVDHLVRHGRELIRAVHPVPREIDEEIARLKLSAMGLALDHLTEAQRVYLASWRQGT